ncbi:MAG TPA: sodium:proton antiporter NhaD [Chloroflexota bacterium]|nr:sodium:proton antiporter NhaD [Chloroflexota bacterium]
MTFTATWLGLASLAAFVVAYAVAMAEERLHVRKSVPVLVAAALIWGFTGLAYSGAGHGEGAAELIRHTLLDFAELFLFLLPAMTFVNTLDERGLFDVLRARLVAAGLSLRMLFWVTGALAFIISPIADNLTTALLLGAVAMAVGRGQPRFVPLACINIVVAANAGGAFSPFGDITTLMVWQAGKVPFGAFFPLVFASLVNWLVPAVILSLAVHGQPTPRHAEQPSLEPGALPVLGLFLGTIVLTVAVHNFLALPAAVGMMAGLGALKAYSYFFNATQLTASPTGDDVDDDFAESALDADDDGLDGATDGYRPHDGWQAATAWAPSAAVATAAPPTTMVTAAPRMRVVAKPLDTFALLEKVEWDTLLFFYGVLLAVGGLGALGYLALTSQFLYGVLGPTLANIFVGLLSAVVDNVPVMFAVLQMNPQMAQGEWLLVTLTTGVGGSLLSVGSAAGVALMGQARGIYTFFSHLRWAWAIALGYAASIVSHLALNARYFCGRMRLGRFRVVRAPSAAAIAVSVPLLGR